MTLMQVEELMEPLRALSYGRNSSKKQQSIRGQLQVQRELADEQTWSIVAELSDGTSASVYATKVRDKWAELLELVPTVDVVMMWEASRGDRDLETWVGFLKLCRRNGVLIHATGHGTTYDPRKPRDFRSLAEDGVDAMYESDKTSMRLTRGMAAAAGLGRPHAHTLYGYERVYHPTRRFVEQRPHEEQAEIVREIVRRIGKGDPVSAVTASLTKRGVPAPAGATVFVTEMVRRSRQGERADEIGANLVKRGALLRPAGVELDAAGVVSEVLDRAAGVNDEPDPLHVIAADLVERGVLSSCPPWKLATVQAIVRNRGYLGVRVHRSKAGTTVEHPGAWPALVTEEEYNAAMRVLTAPDRQPYRGARPGRATTLLGHIVYCGSCGGRLAGKTMDIYRCCIQAKRDELETLVTEVVIARLTDPKVFRKLRKASDGDDKIVLEARARIGQYTAELAAWRASAVAGKTTPDSLAVIEAGLTAKIREEQRRAEQAATPPVVRDLVGPGGDVRARWLAAPLGARRDVIKALMTVTLYGVTGRGPKLTDRVEIAWR